MGSFSPSPNYPGGSRGAIAQAMMPDFNHAFGQFPQGQTPTQAQNQPAIDAVNQFTGRGTGVGAFNTPSSQPSQFDLAHGAFPSSSGSFADRFAPVMGGNPGTPNQYYTGSQYPGAQAPPRGFQTPFSADNPGGALPVGWGPHQPAGAPMMNAGGDDEPSQDTLSPRDRAIGQGSRRRARLAAAAGLVVAAAAVAASVSALVPRCRQQCSRSLVAGGLGSARPAAPRAAASTPAVVVTRRWSARLTTPTATRSSRAMRHHSRRTPAGWAAVSASVDLTRSARAPCSGEAGDDPAVRLRL
jgi:hypothetical protein